MEVIDLGPLYKAGYYAGAEDVINRVGKWLDEDTVAELREEYLGKKDDSEK